MDEKSIDIKKIASLAKLQLCEKEALSFEKDMREIIAFAGAVSGAAIDGELLHDTGSLKNVYRSDIAEEGLSRKDILAAAPTSCEGCITVPKILN